MLDVVFLQSAAPLDDSSSDIPQLLLLPEFSLRLSFLHFSEQCVSSVVLEDNIEVLLVQFLVHKGLVYLNYVLALSGNLEKLLGCFVDESQLFAALSLDGNNTDPPSGWGVFSS